MTTSRRDGSNRMELSDDWKEVVSWRVCKAIGIPYNERRSDGSRALPASNDFIFIGRAI